MALGGGNYVTQNKILPGSYINVVSAANSNADLSDRGIVALPIALSWGQEGSVITKTKEHFGEDSLKFLGHDYASAEMVAFREIFACATKIYVYRLGMGEKASSVYCDAKYTGTRGNDIKVAIATNVDDETKSDVKTYLGTMLVDSQTVLTSGKTDALKSNDFVVWKLGVDLTNTAGLALTGGTNATVTGNDHTTALAALESVSFNVLVSATNDPTTKAVYYNYTKRMRDELGIKFQCVLHKYESADYEGVISVENNTPDCVYWVAGALAGCGINQSLTNRKYNGEHEIETTYTQSQLEDAIKSGKFVFHRVGDDVRVLKDINTLITATEDKGEVFRDNQTIRVVDQIANDIANLFNTKYLGVVPNDAAGRISLWADIVKHHEQLATIRAIEPFDDANIVVSQGDSKQSVVIKDAVTIVNSMTQLYMTCIVQ